MKLARCWMIFLTLTLLVIAASGCGNLGYENGVVSVDMTLSAETLNGIVDSVGLESNGFVGKIEKIELIEPNIMRITGNFKLLGKEKKGGIDFAIETGRDGVWVNAVNSTIPGVTGDTPAVKTFSNALARALGAFVAQNGDKKAGVTDIKVKNGRLVFTLSLKVK